MATFRPSTKPASPSPSRNALTRLANAAGDPAPRYPITGIVACCACPASGQAAAPPTRVMNFRLLIQSPHPRAIQPIVGLSRSASGLEIDHQLELGRLRASPRDWRL